MVGTAHQKDYCALGRCGRNDDQCPRCFPVPVPVPRRNPHFRGPFLLSSGAFV